MLPKDRDVPLVSVLALLTRGGAGQRAEEGPESREQEREREESTDCTESTELKTPE